MINIDAVERKFSYFLSNAWSLDEVTPFLRSYVRLLLAHKSELSSLEIDALLERQRQLDSNLLEAESFAELRNAVRAKLESGAAARREDSRNRLLFGAFLDSTETDFFYLVEPLFEFARNVEIDPALVKVILEEEFPGLEF